VAQIVKKDHHRYPPVGYCIYCGSMAGKLTDEHIVPYALNGNWILPKASCQVCQKIIQKYEDACLRIMFKPLRTRFEMQSRRPKEHYINVEFIGHDGARSTLRVHHKHFPVIGYGMRLPIAGIILGEKLTDTFFATILFRFHEGETEKFMAGFSGVAKVGSFDATAFMRMIAKIGYSYAAAELGAAPLHPMLADLVLARAPNSAYLSHLVGGEPESPRGDFTNRLELIDYTIKDTIYTVVQVQLFGFMGMPKYHVVVREKPKN
jgi:hypothetical protein